MKRIILNLLLLVFSVTVMTAQTSLEGTVNDATNNEALGFAAVEIYKNDVFITGTDTDFDGNYFFSDIDPGTYDITVSFLGYTTQKQTGVLVKAGKSNRLNFSLSEEGVLMDAVEIVAYKVPLIEIDNTTSGATVTAEKIRSLPIKDIAGIAATSAGISSTDSGDISVRGSRKEATVYYIDGVRVSGADAMIPQSEIDQMRIITGGVEARYGDLVGGAISITTKGPSKKFMGGVEAETSEFLDGYGYNLLSANVTGPIVKKSNGDPIIGFRLSGQFRDIKDNFPVAGGVWALSKEKIAELEKDPTFTIGGAEFSSLEKLTEAKLFKARPNNGLVDLNTTARIDARINSAIDVSLSGSYNQANQQFAPSSRVNASGSGAGFNRNYWRFANWTHNPYENSKGYRGNFRFRHKIGQQSVDKDEDATPSSLQNFSYVLQAGFEKRFEGQEDALNKQNLFNYGYYGKTERNFAPTFGIIQDTASYAGVPVQIETPQGTVFYGQTGYLGPDGEYTPSESINTVLAGYNNINGFIQPNLAEGWGLYRNVGAVYNTVNKSEDDILSLNADFNFDFLPGGSKKGRHSIQFGLLYEQRTNRFWRINPKGLWDLARVSVNGHLTSLDTTKLLRTEKQTVFGTQIDVPVFAPTVTENQGVTFYSKLRQRLGKELIDYINIDGVDPNDLSLDMFSASELNDQNLLNYYGYDYLGNKLNGNESFEDFFSSVDANGVRTFVSPAIKPIYGAAYIQDKFSYKDLILRLGVRMDYYDANTKVLKDPYSLYEIQTADEFYAATGQSKPDQVGGDYRVYVKETGSNEVIGFRKGDDWYNASGSSVTGGNVLFGGGLVYPAIKGTPDIKKLNYDINSSFKDYEAQLNIMPRLAFSFPISDDANFFAHYDVLYQRPSTNTVQTPRGYYYWERAAGQQFNNPDLKPVRTVDYEIGFQQKLNSRTALKMAAYYKEQKDLIQNRVYAYLPAPVGTYNAYGNIDFSTIKGFTFQLDRRRTSNLELTATYTLQFADGSGSDANSSNGLNTRGIIRNLVPLSFDERHRVTAVIDYRFTGDYNGPTIGGVEIFKDAGVNFNIATVSGRPYSRRSVASKFGGTGYNGAINGSRLPWTFNIDMMMEKGFRLFKTETSRGVSGNVYFRVQNLLDTRNVRDVFSFSGNADDDGYLVSTFGVDEIRQISEQGKNVDAFRAAYNWRLDSYRHYSLPRRIFLGVRFNF